MPSRPPGRPQTKQPAAGQPATRQRIGLWIIGAKGGVATTAMTGLAALCRGAIQPIGLVTSLDPFTQLA